MRTRRGLRARVRALDTENDRLHAERRELAEELRRLRVHAAAAGRENDALRLLVAELGRQLHQPRHAALTNTLPMAPVIDVTRPGNETELLFVPWRPGNGGRCQG